MSERKRKILGLTVTASILLLLGYLAYMNDGNFLWFIPGIVVYIVNVIYIGKKPPKIVYDDEEG